METSKVVPPPLGEPPSPLTPPPLPAAQSGAERTGLCIANQRSSWKGKKEIPSPSLGTSGLQKWIEEKVFEMLLTESKTILGLAVE